MPTGQQWTLFVIIAGVFPLNALDALTCKKASDCVDASGMICKYKFEPCHIGTCMCPEGMVNDNGECVREVKLDEECQSDRQCVSIKDAWCKENFCQCRDGYRSYHGGCMPKYKYKVGEECTANHECVYYDEDNKAVTSTLCGEGKCVCPEMTITQKQQCKTRELGDGCRTDMQCGSINGAICDDGTCQCQSGFQEINSKHCRLSSGIGELGAGDYCGTDSNCKEDLACRKCHDTSKNKTCVYLNSGSRASTMGNFIATSLIIATVTISIKLC